MGTLTDDELSRLIDHVERRWGTVDPYSRRTMQHFREYEGFLPFPYLDSKGHATIGLGIKLKDKRDFDAGTPGTDIFRNYRFVLRDYPGTPPEVSPDEVARQIDRLMRSGADRNRPHSHGVHTSIGWTPDYVIETALDKLGSIRDRLREQFPNFDYLPAGVQDVITDIGWNSGENVARKWPKMTAAIIAGDFETAAQEAQIKKYDPVREAGVARRNAWKMARMLEPDPERMYPVPAYPGYQAPPPAADGTYGQDGYPGYAPAASGLPSAGATSRRRAPTLEELHAMSDEDFDANWDRVMQAARGPSIL